MALRMIGDLITNATLSKKNLRVREIDGHFRVVIVNSEGHIIATYKEYYDTFYEAQEKLNDLVEE